MAEAFCERRSIIRINLRVVRGPRNGDVVTALKSNSARLMVSATWEDVDPALHSSGLQDQPHHFLWVRDHGQVARWDLGNMRIHALRHEPL
jgi:hypothetical protein